MNRLAVAWVLGCAVAMAFVVVRDQKRYHGLDFIEGLAYGFLGLVFGTLFGGAVLLVVFAAAYVVGLVS